MARGVDLNRNWKVAFKKAGKKVPPVIEIQAASEKRSTGTCKG